MMARPDASTWRARRVVVISIDTLRADRLGTYGYRDQPTSPNVDQLVEEQPVVFDRAFVGRAVDHSVARRGAYRAAIRSRSAPTPTGDTLTTDGDDAGRALPRAGLRDRHVQHACRAGQRARRVSPGLRHRRAGASRAARRRRAQGAVRRQRAGADVVARGARARDPFFVWVHDTEPAPAADRRQSVASPRPEVAPLRRRGAQQRRPDRPHPAQAGRAPHRQRPAGRHHRSITARRSATSTGSPAIRT